MRHFHVTFLCRTWDGEESFSTRQFYDEDIKTPFPTQQDFHRWEKTIGAYYTHVFSFNEISK